MTKTRLKPLKIIIGALLMLIGLSATILTLSTLVLSMAGVVDINLNEVSGSSVDPISVGGALFFGAIIGLMVIGAGVSVAVSKKRSPGNRANQQSLVDEFLKSEDR